MLVCVRFVLVHREPCGGCVSTCEWSLTSCPSRARVHTLTPSHLLLYMCPPGGHPILSASVCLSSRHSIPPDPLHMYIQRGALFLSFTIETRRVFIPSSFPLSRPAVVCLPGVWGTRLHQNRCPLLETCGLSNILFILIVSVAWMFLKASLEKKQNNIAGGCQGMYAGCFYLWHLWYMLHGSNTKNPPQKNSYCYLKGSV